MDGQNSEGRAAQKKSCTPPGFLFVQPKQRKKEYWQCIKFIAPILEAKKWKLSEAIFACCTLCNCKVKWKSGEVKRLLSMNEKDTKTSVANVFPTKEEINTRPVSKANQELGEALLVKWVAESLRPFHIVENIGFRDLAAFLCRVNGKFSVPTRNSLCTGTKRMALLVEKRMRIAMGSEMNYFAATTNMWSGRKREAFISLTVHYLTEEFTQRNFTLRGRHTAINIQNLLTESFSNWGLAEENLSLMARDNGSNIVAACNMWCINHIGCIGHGLHLVVNPFLHKSKNIIDSNVDESDDNDEVGTNEDVANFEDNDEIEDTLLGIDFIAEVRKTVSDIRKIAIKRKNLTAVKEKLQLFETASKGRSEIADTNSPLLTLVLDVSTRWNSAYDMLTKILRHKDSIFSFLNYLKTSAGRREFSQKNFQLFLQCSGQVWRVYIFY